MNLILNNPFRILGLPITATEREIAKRISDLAIHAEMGAAPAYQTDFPVLSEMVRDSNAIKDASNRIEQPDSKLFYAQFWFWGNNEVDEQAFKYLAGRDIVRAVNLLSKTFEGGKVTKNNYSNMRNLAVLLLASASMNGSFNREYLTKGIILMGKIFDSHYFFDFSQAVAGDTISIDRAAIIRPWVEELLQSYKSVIDAEDGISTKDMLECFKYFPDGIRQYATDKFIIKPLQEIEVEIATAGNRRTDNPERAKLFGVELYTSVRQQLQYLRVILGDDSVRYQSIADKVANEILQCAIDFFNESIDRHDEIKAAEDAKKLAQMALTVAAGDRVKGRVEENIDLVEKWESDQSNKERLSEVQDEVDTILDYVRDLPFIKGLSYYERIRLPAIAEEFVAKCYEKLQIIRSVLGPDDRYYQELSTLVANNAIGMSVLYVNTTDDPRAVTKVMDRIDQLDMEPALRERFDTNRMKLERIMMRRGLVQ